MQAMETEAIMNEMEIMRKRILMLIAESNMGIGEFSTYLGISYETMRLWVKGDRTPWASNIVRICKACDVSADWLLGLKDER